MGFRAIFAIASLFVVSALADTEYSWPCEEVTTVPSVDIEAVTGIWHLQQVVNDRDRSAIPCFQSNFSLPENHDHNELTWSAEHTDLKYNIIANTNHTVWQIDGTDRTDTIKVMYYSTDGQYLALAICDRSKGTHNLKSIILHRSSEIKEDDLAPIRQHLYSHGFTDSNLVKTVSFCHEDHHH